MRNPLLVSFVIILLVLLSGCVAPSDNQADPFPTQKVQNSTLPTATPHLVSLTVLPHTSLQGTPVHPQAPWLDSPEPVGWASVGSGTNGGQGGQVVTVTTVDELQRAVAGDEPRIVVISGLMDFAKGQYAKVGSNKTLYGINNATIRHGGIVLSDVHNIIVRNIEFQDCIDPGGGYDCIHIDRNSTHIWVDYCTLSDDGSLTADHDGLIDITRGSSDITISYCEFHNHNKVMLIGASDNTPSDIGALRVTVHHCFFNGTYQRHPRVRYGMVHLYNNYYRNITAYAIGRGVGSQIYSEQNYFDNVHEVIRAHDTASEPGYAKDIGSINATSPEWDPAGVNWNPAEYYNYSADPAVSVKDTCILEAGANKIPFIKSFK